MDHGNRLEILIVKYIWSKFPQTVKLLGCLHVLAEREDPRLNWFTSQIEGNGIAQQFTEIY